jgi:voltage-gated potassium channel
MTRRPAHPWRRALHEVFEHADGGGRLANFVSMALVTLIVVNVAALILESVAEIREAYATVFIAIEAISVVVFTLEYALRIWCAPEHVLFHGLSPAKARLRYALMPAMLIDLFAILPFYLAFFLPGDFRALLFLRLFRFFKLTRYSPGMASLVDAMRSERRALLACLVILAGTVIIVASAMHLVEHDAQPEKFGSIPAAMYWAVITLTTVGYGDVVPVTVTGRVIGAVTAVIGLVMLALPVGIIASAFAREIHRRDFVVTWSMVAKVPLFSDLAAGDVALIMRHLNAQTCEPGELVVRRGEPAHSMYFINSGEVEVELPERSVVLGAGHFFGEVAVLRKSRRSATVRAVIRTKLLVLDAADLRVLMDQSPEMARRIRDMARERLATDRLRPDSDLLTEEIEGPPDESA